MLCLIGTMDDQRMRYPQDQIQKEEKLDWMQKYALRIKQLLDLLDIRMVIGMIVIAAGSCAFGYYSQSKIQSDDDIL
jgi:hypothetical protein